jgi:hypothetical protein
MPHIFCNRHAPHLLQQACPTSFGNGHPRGGGVGVSVNVSIAQPTAMPTKELSSRCLTCSNVYFTLIDGAAAIQADTMAQSQLSSEPINLSTSGNGRTMKLA